MKAVTSGLIRRIQWGVIRLVRPRCLVQVGLFNLHTRLPYQLDLEPDESEDNFGPSSGRLYRLSRIHSRQVRLVKYERFGFNPARHPSPIIRPGDGSDKIDSCLSFETLHYCKASAGFCLGPHISHTEVLCYTVHSLKLDFYSLRYHTSSFRTYPPPSDALPLHSVLVPCILRINTVLLYTPTSTIYNTTPLDIFDVFSLFESQVQDQETEYPICLVRPHQSKRY